MNLRLVEFNLGTAARDPAGEIANRVAPFLRAQPGCERCEFFGDDESGDYGIMVLWSSKTHADAAAGVVSPVLNAALAQAGATSDRRRLFEVLQLRSEPSLTG